MKISFFCIATEPFKNQYPIKQSVRSILPIADEIIMVFGRREKKSEEYFSNLSDKIKVYNTDQWPIEWKYSVMTYHFDFALQKCTGDICIKFDIDYVFNCQDKNSFEDGFKPFLDKHLIYLPKINYLDKNFGRYFEKGIYAVNRKLLLEENRKYWIGVKDYVNTLFIDGEYEIGIISKKKTQMWVFNFDCTFMNKTIFKEKQYRWYMAYYLENGNLDKFNLTLEQVEDKENLCDFIIKKQIDKIDYAMKKKLIIEPGPYPRIIRKELEKLTPEKYGYNYFGYFKKQLVL